MAAGRALIDRLAEAGFEAEPDTQRLLSMIGSER
ncbi:MAG: hypothetical protein ACI8Y4_002437 [Candidatus Poriferisodalaceae bacterium]|jgi:hypothetical protein